MAVRTFRVDDIDGSDLPEGHETTVLVLNGRKVTVDLSPENLAKLEKAVAKYFEAGVVTNASARPATKNAGDADLTAEIRNWAQNNGHKVADRGRISQDVKDAFFAAHPDKSENAE
jgi:hypothetical protein